MRLRNTKGKRSRKQLSERSAPKNPNKGFLRPKIRVTKGKRQSAGEYRAKKARILWDCLFLVCQGLKIGINRQPPVKKISNTVPKYTPLMISHYLEIVTRF